MLPDDFNEFEHLQSVYRRVMNEIVRDEFKDLGDNFEPSIATPRASLRLACTHKDNDPVSVTYMRDMLFWFGMKKASNLQAPIYGIPKAVFDESIDKDYLPEIRLYFSQPKSQIKNGLHALEGEITVTLIKETLQSINESKARQYAIKIRELFVQNKQGIIWQKGKQKFTYLDKKLGYDFRVLADDENTARLIIDKAMSIQGHIPKWENLTDHNPKKASDIVPKKHKIYGKQRNAPMYRRAGNVRFRYAELKIKGLREDITLVDLTGTRYPLVKVV